MITEIHMIHYNMVVDVSLVYMSCDYVLMFMSGKPAGELYPNTMGLLRCYLALSKRLDDMLCQYGPVVGCSVPCIFKIILYCFPRTAEGNSNVECCPGYRVDEI